MNDRDAKFQMFVAGTMWAAALNLVVFGILKASVGLSVTGAFLLLVLLAAKPTLVVLDLILKIVSPFVESLGTKLAGKVSPEMQAAIKALNVAHENDKLNDNRLTQIESKLNGLLLGRGFERKSAADVVSDLVR